MVTKYEVEKVAALAKLEFSPNEIDSLTGELNSILGYIDQLKEVDVSNVAPLETMTEALEHGSTTPLRKDEALNCVSVEDALKNAPKAADGYFLVPKVLAGNPKTVTRLEETTEDEQDY